MVRSILVLVVGAVLGLTVSIGSSVLAEREAARREAVPHDELPTRDLQLLAEVMERVRRDYVDKIDDDELVERAIRGMVDGLDAHTRYLDGKAYQDIRIATSGNYSGIGLNVKVKKGQVTVVNPVDGAPAARAGILPGDVVVSIDSTRIDAANAEAVIGRMRGRAGTEVDLAVARQGETRPLHFALKRAQIHVMTVRGSYLGRGYGYIRVTSFADTTAADVERAADALREVAGGPLKGLVLDLRDNPGGVLDAAVKVADLFLDKGLIVRGRGRVEQARFARFASPGDDLERTPLVVLVNGGSASASEILAAALQDHHRAELVGERTYGKGSVQTVLPLSGGGAIKLTTSRYFTPSGRSINGVGIEPDVRVEDDPKLVYRGKGGAAAPRGDEQLQRALQTIGYQPIALSKAP